MRSHRQKPDQREQRTERDRSEYSE
jgi:hypothetical protein